VKILLINPWYPEIFPPPGLGYIKAYLQSTMPTVLVQMADLQPALKLPVSEDYELIGISVHSFAVMYIPQLLASLRQRFPRARLVAGGHHASALPKQMLELGFDQVVVGPGEEAMVQIAQGLCAPIVKGTQIADINTIPIPDYRGLKGKWTMPLYQGGKALPVISSRGCPFGCRFCASTSFWGRRWFPRSVDSIMNELHTLLSHNEINSFMFEDDHFTLQTERAKMICRRIIDEILPRYPRLHWQAASRTDILGDSELCRIMAIAGCTHVWLGIESGSPAILESCGKGTSPEKQLAGIEIAEAAGLRTVGQFIVGLPGETDATIEETRQFISRSRLSTVGINKAWVLPGTYLYDAAVANGFCDKDYLYGVPFFTYENSLLILDRWVSILESTGRRMPDAPLGLKIRQKIGGMKRRIFSFWPGLFGTRK